MPFGLIAGALGIAGAVLGAKGQRDAAKAQGQALRYKAQVDNANAAFQQENNAALSRYKTLLDNRYDYTSTLAANQQATADARGQVGLDFDRARITGALQASEAKRTAGELTTTASSSARGTILDAGHTLDQLQLEQQIFEIETRYNASVESAGQHHKARLLEFGADVARREQAHTQEAAEQQLLNDGRAAAAALAQNTVSGASRGVAVDEGTQKKIADDIAVLSNEAQMDILTKMDRELFGLEVNAIGAEKEAEFARFLGASALYEADLSISNRGQLTDQRSNAIQEMANYEASETIRLASMRANNVIGSAADRSKADLALTQSRARERLASTSRSNAYRTELTDLQARSRSSMSEFEIARAAELQEFVAKGRTSLADKGATVAENTGKLNAIGTLIGAAGSVANQWHAYQVGP